MTKQAEALLEHNLIQQLIELGYVNIKVQDGNSLVVNLKYQLETFNNDSYSDKEFDSILNHLAKGNVFEKAKTLRDRYSFTRENGSSTGSPTQTVYVRFFDSENWNNNLFQVTNQVQQEGSYLNR